MRKLGNLFIAEPGKRLKYKDTLYSSIEGVLEEDIKEVYPVCINTDTYYISSTNYSDIVTELIRQKFSLDQELALIANARIGKTSDEEDFQNWRAICKETAKRLTNE